MRICPLLPILLALGLAGTRLSAAAGGGAIPCTPEKSVAAPTSPGALGRLARRCNQVEGQLPGGNPEPLQPDREVVPSLHVTTGDRSAARFALGKTMAATLILGSQSSFLFRPGLFSAAGEIEKFDLLIEWGKLRWAATPQWADKKPRTTLLGVAPHEVYIETKAAKMVLHGTDVYLTVDRESGVTVLYVAEGDVEVTGAAGRTVRVTSGQWTSVAPGEPPRPAEPFDAATASLSPVAGGPAFHAAVEDPFFDLRNPRLDLPR